MDVLCRFHPASRAQTRTRLRQRSLGVADRRLGSGWAIGRYSIADIHLFRLYWRFANSLKPTPESFPNLTAHYARMMARPAVQRTIAIESAIGYELPA
jgi:glutathione S-transferase